MSETSRGKSQVDADVLRKEVRKLARDLRVKVAFVCERVAGKTREARTLALSVDGQFLENLTYPIAGSPCARVYEEGEAFHPKDVALIYPEDTLLVDWGIDSYLGVALYDSRGELLGHVGIMNDLPIEAPVEAEIELRQAATRICTEMERRR